MLPYAYGYGSTAADSETKKLTKAKMRVNNYDRIICVMN